MNEKEIESLAFMAIDELIDKLKTPNSIAKWVGKWVYRFEIYREGVIHPSNKYLAEAYNKSTGGNCSVETMMVAVSVCKRSGVIGITGKGKHRILELNVSTLRDKMGEIQGRRLVHQSARQELEAFRQEMESAQYNEKYKDSYKDLYKVSYKGSYKDSYKLEGSNNRGETSPYNNRERKRNSGQAQNPPQKSRFKKPTVLEIKAYVEEKGYSIDPEAFYDYNEARGWMVGKNRMKDWKAAVRTWNRHQKNWANENVVEKNKPAEENHMAGFVKKVMDISSISRGDESRVINPTPPVPPNPPSP